MFIRIFIYKIKELSRKYWLVGWNFIFPLVLATAFFLGFGNLIKEDPDTFQTLEVGYVNELDESAGFDQVLEELSEENDEGTTVLSLHTYSSKDDAVKAMNNGDIKGFYLESEDGIETIIVSNGYDSTIMNEIVREYDNYTDVITQIAKDHPEKVADAIDAITSENSFISEHNFGNETSQYIQYFYALLAMTSLFSSWISTNMLEGICANMSEQGKRVECAPTPKFMSITAGLLAGVLLQIVSNIIVVIYIQYILGINLGVPMGTMILLCTIGSALGISTGTLMGSVIRNPRLLVTVPLFFTMTCSFFSGLMWGQIKQIIQYNCPIINKINPAALLTNAMYVRSTYGATAEFHQDITIMCLMIAGCIIVASIFLRRRKYVSL
ncbi:ABC-2 type transport system permease protein [Pseudobutyrivibrio ruminis]|uniref:ABC-2 type transport system permease protein n=1 Tax=Pseudobutyrivibrio ruminis TaxID=46206 RepID=A0A1H7LY08_9FIRM|nr:ABC transporter permease [Pseudobutyrivibrio ruminis]SEL03638.1 ABC-2 type transport system permease protein [Pseudobutyrivibrio ruminis]